MLSQDFRCLIKLRLERLGYTRTRFTLIKTYGWKHRVLFLPPDRMDLKFNIIKYNKIKILVISSKRIERGLSCWSKIPHGSPTISKMLSSTSTKTLRIAHPVTSSVDRWIQAYSIGIAILGKLSCPNKKKEEWEMLI